MTDDLDARTRRLAKDLLEALDGEDDPDRLAYAVQKEREDRAALDRFYVQTGQRPGPGEPEQVVAVWDYASRPDATFAIGVLTAEGVARYEYKTLYLRWPETVEEIPRHMRELAESQWQHHMG